jgi:hypothetical protein
MTPSSSAEDEDSAEELSSCDSCAGLGDKVGHGYPLMDWFSRENLNRKPMGFYHRKKGVSGFNVPIIQFYDISIDGYLAMINGLFSHDQWIIDGLTMDCQ